MVLKAPRNQGGIYQNRNEHQRYRDQYLDIPMAPCRLLPNSDILLMLKVKPVDNEHLPEWALKVSGGQVGLLDGELYAYDYAGGVPQP